MALNMSCFLFVVVVLLAQTDSARNIKKRQAQSNVFIAQCGIRTGLGSKAFVAAAGRGVVGSCSNYTLLCLTYTRQFSSFSEQCSVGLWWNNQLNTCEEPNSLTRPDCAAAVCRPPFGTPPDMPFSAPDPRSCYGVYECFPDDTGYIAHFEMCESSHYFDVLTGECRYTLPKFCTRPQVFPTRWRFGGVQLRDPTCFLPRGPCTEPGLVWSSAYCRCVHPSLE